MGKEEEVNKRKDKILTMVATGLSCSMGGIPSALSCRFTLNNICGVAERTVKKVESVFRKNNTRVDL